MNAPVLKFTPAPASENAGYTKLDNATDLLTLSELPNALVKPALFLMSRRGLTYKRAAHWGEVAAFCGRSQTQVAQALKELSTLDLAYSEGGLWFWGNRVSTGNPPETPRKPGMGNQKNAVQHSIQGCPEVKEVKELKKEALVPTTEYQTEQAGEAAGEELETPDPQSPDGEGAHAPQVTSPSQDGLKDAESDRGELNVTGSEKGSAAAHRAALAAIREAGLLPTWQTWIRLNALKQVSQEAQSPLWQTWIQAGRSDLLRDKVAQIAQAGDFKYPWRALQSFMELAVPSSPSAPDSTGRPAFRVGMRIRYPDGSEALVVSVQARGITTDHPQFRDIPLGMLKTLEVIG